MSERRQARVYKMSFWNVILVPLGWEFFAYFLAVQKVGNKLFKIKHTYFRRFPTLWDVVKIKGQKGVTFCMSERRQARVYKMSFWNVILVPPGWELFAYFLAAQKVWK